MRGRAQHHPALYGSYNGSLYQVRRSSDNTTRDIGVLSAGGFANAAAQDSFCAGTTCLITIIYDQSGRNNRLTQAPPGGFSGPAAGGYDNLANATAAPITVGGHKAYGVFVAPGTGYRNNNTNGIATGDQPEGMYAIFDGTHYNGGCCFDYGNAETNSRDNGNGTMEAIYFGNIKVWGYGAGNGPWVMADLENGLFSGVNAAATTPTTRPSTTGSDRHRQGRAEPLGHPGRQRAVRRPVDLLQRSAPQRRGLQPDEEGGGHHPRHRRRQQHQRRRHLLRRRDDVRLPVGRHRERGAGQHRRRRLRHRLERRRLGCPDPRLVDLAAGHDGLLHRPATSATRHDASVTSVITSSSSVDRQGRRHVDRTQRSGQQRLRVVRVEEHRGQLPAALQLPAPPGTPTTAARCSPPTPPSARRPAERPGQLVRVVQLLRPVTSATTTTPSTSPATAARTPSTPPASWADDVSWIVGQPWS